MKHPFPSLPGPFCCIFCFQGNISYRTILKEGKGGESDKIIQLGSQLIDICFSGLHNLFHDCRSRWCRYQSFYLCSYLFSLFLFLLRNRSYKCKRMMKIKHQPEPWLFLQKHQVCNQILLMEQMADSLNHGSTRTCSKPRWVFVFVIATTMFTIKVIFKDGCWNTVDNPQPWCNKRIVKSDPKLHFVSLR